MVMLDLGFLRDNPPLVEQKLRDRGMDPREVLRDFQALDSERRKLITEAETLTAQRNRKSEEVAKLKKEKQNADELIAETKAMRERIEELNKAVTGRDRQLQALLTRVPNLPHFSVPVGKSADENVEVRRWGAPPIRFHAQTALGTWRAARYPRYGTRGQDHGRPLRGLLGAGRKLERALINFMLDLHTREHGYTEVLPPFMVNRRVDVRHRPAAEVRRRICSSCERTDYYLIPTAEVPVTNLYRDETMDGDKLPI